MTTTTEPGVEPAHELLKVDSRGRVQISLERRAALLEEFDRSGMTGAGFARHYGIKYTTFAHWIRMRKKERMGWSKPEEFLLVTAEPRAKVEGILIQLPNGASLAVASISLPSPRVCGLLSSHVFEVTRAGHLFSAGGEPANPI